MDMTINASYVPCVKACSFSQSSLNHYKRENSGSRPIATLDNSTEGSYCSLSPKHGKYKKKTEYKSPYLKENSVQLLSRVTEKRFIHKNGVQNISSFPLTTNIYKANSDDPKGLANNSKKVLKSVLTLPNDPTPSQLHTVSDMNDSEYCNEVDDSRKKARKRNPPVHTRKYRPRVKGFNTDAQFFSDEIDIHLDSSSDTIKKCGDYNKPRNLKAEFKGKAKEKDSPHDVWEVLRNINRFQFRPTPQISEESYQVARKKSLKRRDNRKDLRVFETRRTEEFAYISSYNVEKSPCYSRCSSFDKITVIDKKQEFKANNNIENNMQNKKKGGKQINHRSMNKILQKPKSPPLKHNNLKALTFDTHKKEEDTDKSNEGTSKIICPYNNELTETITKNASVDLGYESRTTENDEDLTSLDQDTTQMSQNCEKVYSDNSGSSKAAFLRQASYKQDKGEQIHLVQFDKQINGITKVILSKGQNMNRPIQYTNVELSKKPTHASSVVPTNPVITPKLTKTEINRQLKKYKFPVVVLEKDQLKSSIHVINTEHPQFNGIDKQIWPFMQSWYGIERPYKVIKKLSNSANKKAKHEEVEKKAVLKNNNSLKQNTVIDKIQQKRAPLPLSEIITQVTPHQKKLKPMNQLKDKMLKLLYKNVSITSVLDGSNSTGTIKKKIATKVDTCTDTRDNLYDYNSTLIYDANLMSTIDACATTFDDNISTLINDNNTASTVKNTMKLSATPARSSVDKRSWAKAKWASDFIDNVIKKIKSGVYYNQDNKIENRVLAVDLDEKEIQTEFTEDNIQVMAIPGFNNALPDIEIETMNMNEVSVKHCLTNILVHFDVTVPTKPFTNVKSASAMIPVNVTNSLTKVFKCPTSILNAMLPAELCSIFPKMLHKIVKSREHLALFSMPINDISSLSTITEVSTCCEYSTDLITSKISAILPYTSMPMAQELRQLLNGRYSFKESSLLFSRKFHVLRNTSLSIKDKNQLCTEFRPHISRVHLFVYNSNLMMPIMVKMRDHDKLPALRSLADSHTQQVNTCTILQPYSVSNRKVIPLSKPFTFMNFFEKMAAYINNIAFSRFSILHSIDKSNPTMDMKINKTKNIPEVITLTISDLAIVRSDNYSDSIDKIKILPKITNRPQTAKPDNFENNEICDCGEEERLQCHSSVNNNNTKRRGYGKLYRKCKSASYISREKVTPLNRIANLDYFFQALGSDKLAGVFDGRSGCILMSSIKELKNWTMEINPEQALLVLLLSNKKNTPNLSRYRPVLLQGIAVKRITKAHELDMEIEVIERENLDGTCQYEGFSYIPASIENQDSLYEELCWIAKNTASDYQKPFDQNSERLLKSLLEKRKKLNPSYLRVMARYVGLGLLKAQGKKQTLTLV